MGDGTEQQASNVVATSDYAVASAQGIVILALKAHQAGALSGAMPGPFGPDTAVVTMHDGIRGRCPRWTPGFRGFPGHAPCDVK